MMAHQAAELMMLFEQHALQVYVDGGWAVDALLERQTRPHRDLDIALPHSQVPILRELLSTLGYTEERRDDSWECNFVLAHPDGREVDVHSYTLDEAGDNIYGVAYRAEHLTGTGTIDGQRVRCVPPEWLVKFHSGYKLDQNDYQDVRALCERFGIAMPEEYSRFAT
jgi:lincosamide nucleotidyltransferase A/C/D/E